jgi:hypothetical protein
VVTRRGKAGWAVRPFLGTAIRGRGERRDGSRGVHAAARPPGDVVSERRVRVQDGGGSRTRTRPSSSPSPPRSRSIDPRRLARGPSPSTPRAFFSPLVDHHITSSFVAERRPADVRPPVRSLTSLLPAPPFPHDRASRRSARSRRATAARIPSARAALRGISPTTSSKTTISATSPCPRCSPPRRRPWALPRTPTRRPRG